MRRSASPTTPPTSALQPARYPGDVDFLSLGYASWDLAERAAATLAWHDWTLLAWGSAAEHPARVPAPRGLFFVQAVRAGRPRQLRPIAGIALADLDELEQLGLASDAETAVDGDGPWAFVANGEDHADVVDADGETVLVGLNHIDATFLVKLRNLAPALIRAARRALRMAAPPARPAHEPAGADAREAG